ncbi:MAG TPA: Hsp20/alpha crystallin family protein [Candidatus Acidoferrales bacterium]|jgi:hypothetical protein|nr:Hsp20/alpha crystallin family protein [Candidatus Acidoferrales bacterium]
MTSEGQTKQSCKKVEIRVVSANDQTARIQGAIARRAFFHAGDHNVGHELDNWRLAKSELLRPSCFGEMIRDDAIWIGIDTRKLVDGTIEVWVSPRHVTICGIARDSLRGGTLKAGSQEQGRMVFHSLDMPVDIEPSAVTSEFNGTMLEICFPKAHELVRRDLAS